MVGCVEARTGRADSDADVVPARCVAMRGGASPRPQALAAQVSAVAITVNRTLMLVARQLTKSYRSGDRELRVLRDISFTIPDGAFVAIVGPSGSGKTTLLGLLAGLDTPTAGAVLLDGK